MNLTEKVANVLPSIRSIARHDDASIDEVNAALAALVDAIDEERMAAPAGRAERARARAVGKVEQLGQRAASMEEDLARLRAEVAERAAALEQG